MEMLRTNSAATWILAHEEALTAVFTAQGLGRFPR
jgi:hypothetical protein